MKYLPFFILLIFICSCKDPVLPAPKNQDILNDNLEKELEKNKSRDVWQRPSEVLDLLGDIKGKTVADIGAGTGFFSFRLLFRQAKVIAIDIDPRMLGIIENFKSNLNVELQKNIETRLALPNNPKLKHDEADIVLIINTIGYIENRAEYLETIYHLLPEKGEIMIVDFKRKELPISAPEDEYRVPLYQMEKDLRNAGFQSIESNDSVLDYQYVIIGRK